MSKPSSGRMPDTLGPRFGAVPAENDTYRGAVYGVLVDGSPFLIEVRRPTYGEAMEDAFKASHFYGGHWERDYLRRSKPIYFR